MLRIWLVRAVVVVLFVVAGLMVWKTLRKEKAVQPPHAPGGFSISSPAFQEGETIPVRYTCDGLGISPPLAWSGAPRGTVSFALVVEDRGAPLRTFTHWLLCDIRPTVSGLPEAMPAEPDISSPVTASQGNNDFHKTGYGAPCPPKGHKPHRYLFKLYALDSTLEMPGGFSELQLRAAMKGHIRAEARLTGKYQRK